MGEFAGRAVVANSMAAGRVAELLVTTPSGSDRRGSGYLVAPGLVLTAAHVVEDAATVQVRFDADQLRERTFGGKIEWLDPSVDLAIIDISPHEISGVPCVEFARVSARNEELECNAMGFPRFKLKEGRPSPIGQSTLTKPWRYRDSCNASGRCPALSNLRSGTLEFLVSFEPAADPDPSISPWEGMSGAAVWSGSRIIGVISQHHPSEGLATLAVARADRWYDGVKAADRLRLEHLLGLPESLGDLPDALAPPRTELIHEALVREVDPIYLGVHLTIPAPGASRQGLTQLTPYLQRDHDQELRQEIEQCAQGDHSVFVLLVGDSTTGKTRALYEALRDTVPDWTMLWPGNSEALVECVDSPRFTGGVVLWLNETQQYLYGESGSKAADRLRHLLSTTTRTVVVGAMWHQYWRDLTSRGRSPDEHAAARKLLECSQARRLSVPDHLTGDEQRRLAALDRTDIRLASALAAGHSDGRVIQHLTGGPELLRDYISNAFFTPAEHALITASLDARRLGHESPIAGRLLSSAAHGYLSDRQRPAESEWASILDALTTGFRSDGTDISVRKTLTALIVSRSPGEDEADYEPDDYLDQYTRRIRETNLGTKHLWDALVEHAKDPSDQNQLGHAAQSRGLFRQAATLWKQAAADGHPVAAARLLGCIPRRDGKLIDEAARWIAKSTALDDPPALSDLIRALAKVGADRGVAELANRAAAFIPLHEPLAVCNLLVALAEVGAEQAVATLAERAAAAAPLDHPQSLATLMRTFIRVDADRAIATLMNRDPANQVSLHQSAQAILEFMQILTELQTANSQAAITTLLNRDLAQQVLLDRPKAVARLLMKLRDMMAGQVLADLASRTAREIRVYNSNGVAKLLSAMQKVGADREFVVLAERVAAEMSVCNPKGLMEVLTVLLKEGGISQFNKLTERVATDTSLDNVQGVSQLLVALRRMDANRAFKALASRVIADAPLDDPQGVANLLSELMEAGQEVTEIADRAATAVRLDNPQGAVELVTTLREIGADVALSRLVDRAAAEMSLTKPQGVAVFLTRMKKVEADGAAIAVMAGFSAAEAHLDNPQGISLLLTALRNVGGDEYVRMLLQRDPIREVRLDHPQGVAHLLTVLRKIGLEREVSELARRAAQDVVLDDPNGIAHLLTTLRNIGENKAASMLLNRAANAGVQGTFHDFVHAAAPSWMIERFLEFGRECDGTASNPWNWRDLPLREPRHTGRHLDTRAGRRVTCGGRRFH
ncbi:trypsin-like peptidase domain-containing protein [Streptomyces bobili]|uniref:S1 family peptidase n=1 Tax=Streptomyces bobili TaxID=67280 RepID=UPI0036F04995